MRLPAAISLVALLAGCSANVGDDAADRDATIQGNVTVTSSHVSARFMRVTGMDSRMADQVVDGGTAPSQLGCTTLADDAIDADGVIEMLDVGEVVVSAHAMSWQLATRAFPAVGDLVSGVMYTSRDDDSVLPDEGTYLIETSGSSLVDGFSIQVDAPPAPAGVQLAGVSIDAARLYLPAGEAIAVSWEAASKNDLIIVELPTARCVFEDDGMGVVPASHTSFSQSEIDVSVHRFRQVAVKLPGVDEAYVDFDFAVSAAATVE